MKTMLSINSRSIVGALLGLIMIPSTVFAETEVNVVNGAAVGGYDVVAYFTEGKPVEGNNEFTTSHNGVEYRFASAENRDLFLPNQMRMHRSMAATAPLEQPWVVSSTVIHTHGTSLTTSSI